MARIIAPWASILMRARDFLPHFALCEMDENGTIKPPKPRNADQLRSADSAVGDAVELAMLRRGAERSSTACSAVA